MHIHHIMCAHTTPPHTHTYTHIKKKTHITIKTIQRERIKRMWTSCCQRADKPWPDSRTHWVAELLKEQLLLSVKHSQAMFQIETRQGQGHVKFFFAMEWWGVVMVRKNAHIYNPIIPDSSGIMKHHQACCQKGRSSLWLSPSQSLTVELLPCSSCCCRNRMQKKSKKCQCRVVSGCNMLQTSSPMELAHSER